MREQVLLDYLLTMKRECLHAKTNMKPANSGRPFANCSRMSASGAWPTCSITVASSPERSYSSASRSSTTSRKFIACAAISSTACAAMPICSASVPAMAALTGQHRLDTSYAARGAPPLDGLGGSSRGGATLAAAHASTKINQFLPQKYQIHAIQTFILLGHATL